MRASKECLQQVFVIPDGKSTKDYGIPEREVHPTLWPTREKSAKSRVQQKEDGEEHIDEEQVDALETAAVVADATAAWQFAFAEEEALEEYMEERDNEGALDSTPEEPLLDADDGSQIARAMQEVAYETYDDSAGFVDPEASNDDSAVADEDLEDGGSGNLRVQGSAALVKVMPEDRIRAALEAQEQEDMWWSETNIQRMLDGPILLGSGSEIPKGYDEFWSMEGYSAKERFSSHLARVQREAQEKRDMNRKSGDLRFATPEEREDIARVSLEETVEKVRGRREKERNRPLISDAIGTGPPSPDVYVDIPARQGPEEDGPEKEAVNLVVSRHLGISPEQASSLVRLGAVWVFEDYYVNDWERVIRNEWVKPGTPIRVFPNPERHKTCYVEDWRERVKTVDPDFVVVDKPPMLPCFAQACNGRESLSQCMRESLQVRKWGPLSNPIKEDFTPCHELDDEATGIVALARHGAAAAAFSSWVQKREVVFEYVALTTSMVEKGTYRAYYNKTLPHGPGAPLEPLYWEIPRAAIKRRQDYDSWAVLDMEVVATAELPGDCAAVRIRTYGHGREERIRTQLAMLGAPVLNDKANKAWPKRPKRGEEVEAVGQIPSTSTLHVPEGVGKAGGDEKSPQASENTAVSLQTAKARLSRVPITAVVDDETLLGPYGHKLRLMGGAQDAANSGIQLPPPRQKSPVALHLARLEFGGRVVTCAPPAYWPEGAAAAVAVKLTDQDITSNVYAYLTTHGGSARFGEIGGRFGVNVDWMEEQFIVDRVAGRVFATQEFKDDWDGEMRVKRGDQSWNKGMIVRDQIRKDRNERIRDQYLTPSEQSWKPSPRFKDIKKGRVKKVHHGR